MDKSEKSDIQERNEDKKHKEQKEGKTLFDDAYKIAAQVGEVIEEHPIATAAAAAATVAAVVALTRGRAARAIAPLEGAASAEAKAVGSLVPATESLLANSIAITAETRALASSALVLRAPVWQRAAMIEGASARLAGSPNFMVPATEELVSKGIAISEQARSIGSAELLKMPPWLRGTMR